MHTPTQHTFSPHCYLTSTATLSIGTRVASLDLDYLYRERLTGWGGVAVLEGGGEGQHKDFLSICFPAAVMQPHHPTENFQQLRFC